MVLENKYSVVSFDPEVLREYDIRGIVGDNINLNTAYSLGRVFSTVVQKNKKVHSDKCMTTNAK